VRVFSKHFEMKLKEQFEEVNKEEGETTYINQGTDQTPPK
jgi:hypothetical protein